MAFLILEWINLLDLNKGPIISNSLPPMWDDILKPNIFDALKKTNLGYNNELQVTDAITTLMNWNHQISGYNFKTDKWFDIGTTRQYYHALNYSFNNALK